MPERWLRRMEISVGERDRRSSRRGALMVVALLLLIEVAALETISDALGRGDLFTTLVFALQLVVTAGWFVWLRRRVAAPN